MVRKRGEVFAGRFEIVRSIGYGGNGEVYEVVDQRFDAPRALKVLVSHRQADEKSHERFKRESKAAASIRSDHVVRIYEYGVDGDDTPWLCMELLEGNDLETQVTKHGPLPVEEARRLVVELGHALGAAHEKGVLHLDLKPANLFLARPQKPDAGRELKVLDFGLAHTIKAGGTHLQMTTQAGTPAWMPPEQHNPRAEMRKTADVWPLGLIAFWMLTGKQFWLTLASPETADNVMALMIEMAKGAVGAASERATELGVGGRLPDGFDAWFARCVELDASKRWQDGAEATKGLEALLARASTMPEPRPSPQPSSVQSTQPMAGPALSPGGFTAPVRMVMPTPPPPSVQHTVAVTQPAPRTTPPWTSLAAGAAALVAVALLAAWGFSGPSRNGEMRVDAGAVAVPYVPPAPPPPPVPVCDEGTVLIEGGEFLMGSPASDTESQSHERPQHRVRVNTFCMDRKEVTVDAYRTCTNCTAPNAYRNVRGNFDTFCNWNRPNAGNDPVNCVDWAQAKAFCESRGGSLPTEAQWEFAARGTGGRRYPWGGEAPDATRTNLCGEECTRYLAQHGRLTFTPIANWRDQFEGTAPVGSFSLGATPGTGLLDMAGNVLEWTADWYADHYETSDASLVVDPTGPAAGSYRVFRGGGWLNGSAAVARAAIRDSDEPAARDSYIGFRCARGAR